jgi:hypothetical protein
MGEHSAETKPQRPDLVCMWHEAKASDPDDSLRIGAQGTNEEDQAAAARQVQSLMQISDHVRWRDEIRRRFGETFGSSCVFCKQGDSRRRICSCEYQFSPLFSLSER